jgi:hypothetical protein
LRRSQLFLSPLSQAREYLGYDRGYRAWQPDFRDEDLPPLPEPEPQPQLSAHQIFNGEWWRLTAAAQQPQTSEANENLRRLYGGIDQAIRWMK